MLPIIRFQIWKTARKLLMRKFKSYNWRLSKTGRVSRNAGKISRCCKRNYRTVKITPRVKPRNCQTNCKSGRTLTRILPRRMPRSFNSGMSSIDKLTKKLGTKKSYKFFRVTSARLNKSIPDWTGWSRIDKKVRNNSGRSSRSKKKTTLNWTWSLPPSGNNTKNSRIVLLIICT